MKSYKSYKNLPFLAGICSIEQAMKPGLSVEECVRRLKRYHYAFKRLHQIFTARITAEPGRAIVASAAVTLYTVGTVKELPGIRTYVSVEEPPPSS